MILLIEASNKSPFLTLIGASEIIDIEYLDGGLPLSKTLYPGLDTLLARNHLSPRDLKKAIFGRGPGSFLGTRTAANICSSLRCSLGIEIHSFISPLAFLPFEKGGFAYIMRPKGGKYPVMIGIKMGLDSTILSSHLVTNFNEFFELQEILNSRNVKIDFIVADPMVKKEIEPTFEDQQRAIPLLELQVDRSFLPVLAEIASMKRDEKQTLLSQTNPFGLLY